MRRLISQLYFLIVLAGALAAQSLSGAIEPDGTVDPTFDPPVFDSGAVRGAALQPDGKLVISGSFQKVNGVPCDHSARLNPDGTVDQSFHGSGDVYYRLIVQSDGKILAWSDYLLLRLNSDGSVDSGFDVGNRLNNFYDVTLITAVLAQPDGKLVVTGNFSAVFDSPLQSATSRDQIARFNIDGSLDNSFTPHPAQLGKVGNSVLGAEMQSDGKIVFIWGYWNYPGYPSTAFGIGRLNLDGSLDNTFSPPSNGDYGWYTYGYELFIQHDDRILIPSSYAPYSSDRRTLVRLNANGTLDATFSADAFDDYREFGIIRRIAEQGDGKLLVVGQFHSLGNAFAHSVARLETNGARDDSFNGAGIGPVGQVIYELQVRPSDNRIFIGGYFASVGGATRHNVAWLNPDGSVDATFEGFAGATEATGGVYALATQADGKILVGGFFSSVNSRPRSSLVRLDAYGSVDDSFGVTQGVVGSVYAIKVLPDGKILIAGSLRAVDGVARGKMARLNADGTLDLSFDPNATDGSVYAMALDQSGNIFLGGNFASVGGIERYRLAKLTSNGLVEENFAPAYPSQVVRAITAPSATAGLLVGGDFSRIGNATARGVARLNANTGAIDSTFNAGGNFSSAGVGGGQVFALQAAPDGKYYLGGGFSSYNGVSRKYLARLNIDGALDASFASPNVGSVVSSLALQNGKAFFLDMYDSTTTVRRLTDNGQVDDTFEWGAGTVVPTSYQLPYPTAMEIDPEGRLLIGSTFDHYNGEPRSSLVRLTNSKLAALKVSSITRGDGGVVVVQGLGAPNATYDVQASPDLTATNFVFTGKTVCDTAGVWHFTDSDTSDLTKRFYRLTLPSASSPSMRTGLKDSSTSRIW